MKTYSSDELKEILELHKKWNVGEEGGKCADLRCADLCGADLCGADLRDAYLRGAYLRDAYLRDAYLRGADLRCADLCGADLRGADLRCADLCGADLRDAYLRGADLRGADLRGADLRDAYLRDADLRYVYGNMLEIKSLQLEIWAVSYTKEILNIGCQSHPISEWWNFSDEEIFSMDSEALDWWRKWKGILKNIIELSPAE